MTAKFAAKLGTDKVAVLDPATDHYYQPMWTLVGAGLKTLEMSRRNQADILKGTWIKDAVATFHPDQNQVTTKGGRKLKYDYLIVCTGVRPNFDLIKGARAGLETPGVCSNYTPGTVGKTLPAIKAIQDGDAIFTFPAGPIKCAGAPQKIAYLADDLFRQMKKRDKITIRYNTALPAIFGVKHYAKVLNEIAAYKGIEVNTRHTLVEVKPDSKEAVFDVTDEEGKVVEQKTFEYNLLHISPPCSPIQEVKESVLSNDAGFVTVDKWTMQHTKYPNIFGMGDCADSPNAKTAAAVAAQVGVVRKNLNALMEGKPLPGKYDGYASCPLVTSTNTCVLAEFDYNLEPLETLPISQAKERRLFYFMKAGIMPDLYWKLFVKGWWEGPEVVRKLLHLGLSK